MVTTDLEVLVKKAKYVKNRWLLYAEMVDWLVDLISETYKAKKRFCTPNKIWNNNVLSERFRSGKPLFKGRDIPIDKEIILDLYKTLVRKTEHRRGKLEGFGTLLPGSNSIGIILRSVLENDLSTLESICQKHLADASLVVLLMRIALWPSMRQLSIRAKKDLDLANWISGNCPICGSWPSLATINEGKNPRKLYCSLCETSWPFPRFKCPFCGNDQVEFLFYVYAEEEKDLRVDICKFCGQKVGTLDAKYYKLPIIPILDELVISHLVMATNCSS